MNDPSVFTQKAMTRAVRREELHRQELARQRAESQARFREILERMPTQALLRADHALLGAVLRLNGPTTPWRYRCGFWTANTRRLIRVVLEDRVWPGPELDC